MDEIQNAVETAQRNRQIKPLLKFLVELTNDTATIALSSADNRLSARVLTEQSDGHSIRKYRTCLQ